MDVLRSDVGVAAKTEADLVSALEAVRKARTAKGLAEGDGAQPKFTAWARPRPSRKAPLKSMFLDKVRVVRGFGVGVGFGFGFGVPYVSDDVDPIALLLFGARS